jgi:predicted dehydrogenase
VTGREPLRVEGNVIRDANFGTDAYSSVKADFGDFELSFYCSTQMALRQLMVFHGEKGFIEVHTPFNAGIYGDDKITLHNETHTEAQIFRFPAVHQYKLEAEAFMRAATGGSEPIFDLENSLANQKVIDAIFKSEHLSGWVDV